MTDTAAGPGLFTVGHSNHAFDDFLTLLRTAGVDAIADVRSSPYSRFNPQFNREALAAALERAGVRYAFLGRELGARREEPECYDGSTACYELIARSPLFRRGLDRVRRGAATHRLALLCAEKDPLTCHRMILVCRHLRADGGPITHVHDDGRLESHADAESRLLALCGLDGGDLFHTREELVERAYDMQGARIAYVAPSNDAPGEEP